MLLALVVHGLSGQIRLALTTTSVTPDGTASLDLSVNSPSSTPPAALQWNFQFLASSITNLTVSDGPVVTAASKGVICSSASASYTCLAVGVNANMINNGVIAKVTAILAPGATGASIQVTNPFAASPEGYFIPISASGADFSRAPASGPALTVPSATSDVVLNTPLSWSGSGAAFDIYFGTSSPPPLIASNLVRTTYNPGPLAPCTTYYWKAVGKSAGSNVSSSIYSFTTMASVQLSRNVDILSSVGGSGSVQVTTTSSCAWKVIAHPPDTLTVSSGSSGLGNGTINYSVTPNGGSATRAGYINIADQVFAVLEDGTGPSSRCVTSITGPAFIDSSSQTVTLNVTADSNCTWSLIDDHVDWVSVPGAQNTPTVAVAANSSGASRSDGFVAIPFAAATYYTIFALNQRATPVTFADVAPAYPFFDAIGLLRSRSITDGCASAPLRFCPDDNITRGQMAVFIVRSIMGGDNFTYNATPYFDDTPASYPFFKWIQKMWELGITNGCGTSTYCPDSPVTRGQMAVFIIRTRFGASATFSYPSDPLFSDIGGSFYYNWIQKMGQLGITTGCAPGVYCPDSPVTRGQMAVFIMRGAFNQLLPSPRPIVVSVSPSAALPGQTANVTITGQNTYFNGGSPQVVAGPGITVSNISVSSATSMTAQLSVAPNAATGPRSITVTVPGEIEATLPNGFRVQ